MRVAAWPKKSVERAVAKPFKTTIQKISNSLWNFDELFLDRFPKNFLFRHCAVSSSGKHYRI